MMNRLRLEFAAEGFLARMRREHANQNGAAASPVKKLVDYPPAGRSALMNALERSIEMAGPEYDAAFTAWCEQRAAAGDQTTHSQPAAL